MRALVLVADLVVGAHRDAPSHHHREEPDEAGDNLAAAVADSPAVAVALLQPTAAVAVEAASLAACRWAEAIQTAACEGRRVEAAQEEACQQAPVADTVRAFVEAAVARATVPVTLAGTASGFVAALVEVRAPVAEATAAEVLPVADCVAASTPAKGMVMARAPRLVLVLELAWSVRLVRGHYPNSPKQFRSLAYMRQVQKQELERRQGSELFELVVLTEVEVREPVQ